MATVLFIGNLYREDYITLFEKTKEDHNFIAIDALIEPETNPKVKEKYNVYHWSEFRNIQHIFKKFKPDYIIALHLENYSEVLAKFYAKENNIPFYLIDHGIYRFSDKPNRVLQTVKKKKISLINKIKYKLFTTLSLLQLNKNSKTAFKAFKAARVDTLFLSSLLENGHDAFRPDLMVHFSEYNHDVVNHNYRLEKFELPYKVIGFPYFDEYYNKSIEPHNVTEQKVCFIIDNPFYSKEFFNHWGAIFSQLGYTVYTKLHPLRKSLEDQFSITSNIIEIHTKEELLELFPQINLCIGYNSTLFIPFLMSENCKTFSMESGLQGSSIFETYNLQTRIPRLATMEVTKEILQSQEEKNHEMLTYLFYKYDGNSGKRLSEIFDK